MDENASESCPVTSGVETSEDLANSSDGVKEKDITDALEEI